jgi:hypothetical protein
VAVDKNDMGGAKDQSDTCWISRRVQYIVLCLHYVYLTNIFKLCRNMMPPVNDRGAFHSLYTTIITQPLGTFYHCLQKAHSFWYVCSGFAGIEKYVYVKLFIIIYQHLLEYIRGWRTRRHSQYGDSLWAIWPVRPTWRAAILIFAPSPDLLTSM